ncbi:hypothetical protein GFC29_1185 [Anoxybacillus sp. B7M1]|nr:hypothetical protein GFC28_439 [Anoxybacillus sp. B2M1]ANB63894.1 hypothetical protein GFC29_1185 [Anoxybacillus sp. B7M1]KXG09781.1 hypothetical protein AT864_01950 [Anoxybacillus sp. P3H1B]MBB3908438.1 hypothetical protein [Anoxybacillus rupiensis]
MTHSSHNKSRKQPDPSHSQPKKTGYGDKKLNGPNRPAE